MGRKKRHKKEKKKKKKTGENEVDFQGKKG